MTYVELVVGCHLSQYVYNVSIYNHLMWLQVSSYFEPLSMRMVFKGSIDISMPL